MGQHYVILNSEDVAVDLLEKRSAIYSDRPQTPMLHGLRVPSLIYGTCALSKKLLESVPGGTSHSHLMVKCGA